MVIITVVVVVVVVVVVHSGSSTDLLSLGYFGSLPVCGSSSQQHQQQTGDWCTAKLEVPEDDDESPLKLFYDDALQR